MGHNATKIELFYWLSTLEAKESLVYLKVINDSMTLNQDSWLFLGSEQKEGISRGLKDIEEGSIFSHSEIQKRYVP